MKKLYIILGLMIIFVTSIMIFDNKNATKYINYNGFKLALLVDGKEVETLPSGKYFLVNYECNNDTELSWDYDENILTYNNINVNDKCTLKFESSPKLYDLVKIGDYITYTGNNGCTENQCNGWNAKQTGTDLYENYGYCIQHLFKTYGWRVLHKTDNSVYIVSAGAPECENGVAEDSEATINIINEISQKYCNISYLSGGICNYETAHAFNGDDFYKFTSQYYGSENGRYLYQIDDQGTFGEPFCYDLHTTTYCGYNNDIINNGSNYWFGTGIYSQYTMLFNSYYGRIGTYNKDDYNYGVRPVLKLDSSILATGGAGTMKEPYTISERVTE